MALVKYNNNSISAVTAAASIPSGSMNLITTNTITSGVSSSSFTSNIDSTYDTYIFKYINIHPASDGVRFTVNFRDGGSAFDATKTSTHFYTFHDEADSTTNLRYDTAHDLAQSTAYQDLNTSGVGNGDDESISGSLFLFSPSDTTFVKHFITNCNQYRGDNISENDYSAGYGNTTSAINAVDFKFSSGNIDSGTFKLYGIS